MTEAQPLFAMLRQSAQPNVVDALERLVREAPDRKLSRINALAFAASEQLDEEQTISAFLQASRHQPGSTSGRWIGDIKSLTRRGG